MVPDTAERGAERNGPRLGVFGGEVQFVRGTGDRCLGRAVVVEEARVRADQRRAGCRPQHLTAEEDDLQIGQDTVGIQFRENLERTGCQVRDLDLARADHAENRSRIEAVVGEVEHTAVRETHPDVLLGLVEQRGIRNQ
nr:hypothetical protein GCM10017611_84530 [Rhodococcus wratislaviensis]